MGHSSGKVSGSFLADAPSGLNLLSNTEARDHYIFQSIVMRKDVL